MRSSKVHEWNISKKDCTMAETDTRSLQQIKRETEQTRAGLTHTVEELKASVADTASDIRRRISPDAIKAEVSGYFRTRGEQLLNDVTAAARRNPMQAVAVGASVAYPLLRMARTIPLPVLMVGAGLFFAGSKQGQAVLQKASDAAADLSDEVVRRAHDIGDQVGDSASAAKAYANDQLDRIKGAASGAAEQVSGVADTAAAARGSNTRKIQEQAGSIASSVASGASDLRGRATELRDGAAGIGNEGARMANSAASTVQEFTSGASAAARDATSATADVGLNAARKVRDTASDLTDRTGKTVFQTIEQNPLVVAGVGLLLGGLIASALPRSNIEDDLVGDASNSVKRRAEAAASQGLDAAKDAVGDVFDQAARQAEAEGLTPDGLGKAAQDVGQRVRRVAEAAVTSAFEPAQDTNQQNSHGGNRNG
jgi:hypothetical protein